MSRIITFLICLGMCLSFLGAVKLSVFYTGDTHGVYEPFVSKDSTQFLGGYCILENYLQRERAKAPRSLYLDAGDQQTGTVFSSLVEDGVHGGAVITAFNMLGLDASTFGNHEFDFSYSNTRDLVKKARYPFVSTNLVDKCTGRSVGREPYTIINRDSLRIGIFGITLQELPEKVKAQNIKSLRILSAKEAIDKYLDEVDKKTDLIIVLTHQGFEADSLLALALDNRVDMIIGGHDHIYLEQPASVNGIRLLYSGSHTNFLGKAVIDVVNDRIASLDNELITLISSKRTFDTTLARYVQDKATRIDAEMSKVLGTIPEDWVPDKYKSTPVSRWLANSLKDEYKDIYHPDISIINNGGIRKIIPAGKVTLRDMSELLPFHNTVVVFSCYGRDIIAFDELNARNAIEKPHDICDITTKGYSTEICKYPEQEHWNYYYLDDKTVLDPDTKYKVVSHDYITGQWDKYLGFKPFDVYDTGEDILDAAIRQLQKQYGDDSTESRD
jgi:5'-nucleotidase / UDP-sugar diphosphatase